MKAHSPLLGFNNNVRHRGRVFHIQTEDSGIKHPHVITHLFADGGRIVQSTKTSYTEFLGDEELSRKVRSLMQEQHKAMFISLRAGKFDHLLEGIPLAEPASPAAETAPAAARTPLESTVAIEIGNESEEAKLVARARESIGAGAAPVPSGPATAAIAAAATSAVAATSAAAAPKSPGTSAAVAEGPLPEAPPPSRPRERRDSVAPGAAGGIRLTPPRSASIPPPPSEPGRASHPATLPPAPYAAARGVDVHAPTQAGFPIPPMGDGAVDPDGRPARMPIPRTDDPEVAPPIAPPSAQDFWQLQNRDVRTPPPARRPGERPARPDPRAELDDASRSPSLGARAPFIPTTASGTTRRDAPSLGVVPPPPAAAALEAADEVSRSVAPQRAARDLPPPPAALLRNPSSATSSRSLTPAHTSATNTPSQAPASTPPGRYAPSRPASIFGAARPQEGTSIFGEDLISEKSLDEVILSYLAEDLEPPPKK